MPVYLFNAYSITLLIASALSLSIALYAWTQRHAHSAMALGLMALTIAEWSLGYALEIAAVDFSTKIFWGKMQYIGITTVPLTWLIFALRHTVRGKRSPWWVMLLSTLLPTITIVMTFTTEIHGWLWKEIGLYEGPYFSALDVSYGLWFWVHTAYSYVLLLAGTGLILRTLARREGMYRGQATALLIAALAPWIGNALYLSGLSPIPNLDLTPFAFTVTIIGLAWAIFGYQLVNLSPMARDLLVDSMTDGMIVLDGRARVADMNPAAGHMIGMALSQAIGKPAAEIFAPWPELLERFGSLEEASEQIRVGEGEARRSYELRLSPLRAAQGQSLGRMIMLRDVTEGIVPVPRFAPRTAETAPHIETEEQPAPPVNRTIPLLGWLFNFVRTPLKTDLPTPPDVNPKWYQARERSFTLILRVAALVGTLTWFVAPSFTSSEVGLPFAIIIAVMWFLGLVRQINFNTRALLFLVLLYALACTETYSFGYSVESVMFFLALNVISVLLLGRNGGVTTFAISVLTWGAFGVQIGRGAFIPPSAFGDVITPSTLSRAITALLTFAATSAALIAATLILMESLNRAWRLETQALNLLQQERDLLEVRVQERTRDLATARDDALQSRDELRKYFLAIEQSGNTIVITDPQGNIEYANPRFSTLTGYTLEEAKGQNPRILQSGEHSREFYQDLWDTIRGGMIWHGEFHNRRKDGSLFWESATVAPVLNYLGETTHYVAIKEDITAQKELQEQLRIQNDQMAQEIIERVHAESRLQESEARFRQIVENASDIIYRISPTGHFTYVNPTGVRIMGYPESEVIGKHYLDLTAPEYRHKMDRLYKRQVLGKIPTTYQEFPAITADGSEIWLGQNVQSIMEDDQVIELQALARDVTERKRFEDALSLARDQALEASQVKSQLLSKVNHELRTPLGGILGFAELLRTGVFGALNKEQDKALGEIMDSVHYLTGIVSELLDAAQIEARKMTLHLDPCNPHTILQQVETQLSVLARNKGLAFSAEAAPELPATIIGDERRLKQIAINLVGNAIKFTQAGEVRLKMFCTDAHHWAIQVSDTGIGIPPEAQNQIFEPFRQLHASSTREHRGTGLGLSITRQLVELMGGEISLESETGRGSTFTVRLPIHTRTELGTKQLLLPKEERS